MKTEQPDQLTSFSNRLLALRNLRAQTLKLHQGSGNNNNQDLAPVVKRYRQLFIDAARLAKKFEARIYELESELDTTKKVYETSERAETEPYPGPSISYELNGVKYIFVDGRPYVEVTDGGK